MDPTLAPGYIAPNIVKKRVAKGHHWAEIQKERAAAAARSQQESGNSSAAELDTATTPNESDSSAQGPKERPLLNRPVTSDGDVSRHPRLASWRGGRSALSDGEGIGGPADLEEVPIGVKRQALQMEDYNFPDHRLRTVMDGNRTSSGFGNMC